MITKLLVPVIRTTIVATALVIIAILVQRGFTEHELKQANEELRRLNEQMQQRLETRQRMIRRLSTTRRIAHLRIGEQQRSVDGDTISTTVELIELDEQGAELARQTFTLPGDVVFVDAWTVKFGHGDVANGNPLTGRTLVLLRRMYSDQLAPVEGPLIDTPGAAPPAYAVSDAGRFEQQIWKHFWTIASDATLAESMGVRVAQGEAVYKRVRSGQTYELIVDAAGGMSLTPIAAEDQALSLKDDAGSPKPRHAGADQ